MISLVIVGSLILTGDSEQHGRVRETSRLKQLERAFRSLQKMAATVEYSLRVTTTIPKGNYTDLVLPMTGRKGEFPRTDYTYEWPAHLLLDFSRNRARKTTRKRIFNLDRGIFVPDHSVEVFDGKRYKRYQPRKDNFTETYKPPAEQADLLLLATRTEGVFFDALYHPVLYAHGTLIGLSKAISARSFRLPVVVAEWAYRSTVTEDGTELHVFRTRPVPIAPSPLHELWVDFSKDGAVVKVLYFPDAADTRPSHEISIQYEKSDGDWLPVHWKVLRYHPRQGFRLTRSDEVQVENIRKNIPVTDASFDIPLEAGMTVRDVETEERFRVGTDGKTLIRVGAFSQKHETNTGLILSILVSFALLVFVLLVVWQYRRHRGLAKGK